MPFGSDSKTPSLKNLLILSVAFLFLGSACDAPASFEEIPEQMHPPSMLLGPVEQGAEVDIASPEPAVGATIEEGMSLRLQARGLAPLVGEVKSKGTWESPGNEELVWKLKSLTQRPEAGRLGKKLKERLATLKLPRELPLGPYSLLAAPVGAHDFPLTNIPIDEASGLRVEGRWRCNRVDGVSGEGSLAKDLSCVLEDGFLIQEGKGPHTGTVIKARLVGILRATRGTKGDSKPSVEEVRVELAAQSEAPNPLSFQTSYYRIWCAIEGACLGGGS